jgi:hypothetical protein
VLFLCTQEQGLPIAGDKARRPAPRQQQPLPCCQTLFCFLSSLPCAGMSWTGLVGLPVKAPLTLRRSDEVGLEGR